jgi:hypothetical protein
MNTSPPNPYFLLVPPLAGTAKILRIFLRGEQCGLVFTLLSPLLEGEGTGGEVKNTFMMTGNMLNAYTIQIYYVFSKCQEPGLIFFDK